MKKYSLIIAIALIASCLNIPVTMSFSATDLPQRTFYVAPDGDDNNPGTFDRPFKTPEKARDVIRGIKKNDTIPEGGIIIWLRGGDYIRQNALELTADDSGNPDARISWRAYSNERVRMLGGRVINGFKPVKDNKVLNRLNNQARGNVLVADLRAQGIEDFGEMRSRGHRRPITPVHGELFFNGSPMTLARWPNAGKWEHIKDFPEESAFDNRHGTTVGALSEGFYYDSDRPARWKYTENIWIHGYWTFDWSSSYERVAELDHARRFIKTEKPYGTFGFNRGQRFYFLNILEELDQPGQWFLDRDSGKLYFWPPAPIESGEVLFSVLEEPFLQLNDVSHVSFSEMVFEATRGIAINIDKGAGNRIEGCVFRNIGNEAVTINDGKNHGIVSCDIFDTGYGGVSISAGDTETLTPGNHFVENCHFYRQGRWTRTYVPAINLDGVGLRASHNLIHDHPHAAILFWGNDHLIEFNEIHNVALETGDVGMIYSGRSYKYRGNRIRYNYLHHTRGPTNDARGVYMDDAVSGTEIYGNVFHKVHWAVVIGGGRHHLLENNLFVDCDPAIVVDGRGLDTRPLWRNRVKKTMRPDWSDHSSDLYRHRYPAMKTLDAYYGKPGEKPVTGEAFKGVPPEGNVIVRNAGFGDWIKIHWLADEAMFDIRNNYVTEKIDLIGGPETSFLIPPESAVWETGFRPIPFEKIGLYTDQFRTQIPDK